VSLDKLEVRVVSTNENLSIEGVKSRFESVWWWDDGI
jgi:hypothetical protein